MMFPLYNAIESLDRNQIEAARDLGAPWWHIHLFVVMPYAKPGIASGATLVFMLCAGALAAPLILGGPKTLWFTPIVYDRFFQAFNWPQGAAYALILLLGLHGVRAAGDAALQGAACRRSRDEFAADRARSCSASISCCSSRFLFGPLVDHGITAFNTPSYPQVWPIEGFTLNWFGKLFADRNMMEGLQQQPPHRRVRRRCCRCRSGSPARS